VRRAGELSFRRIHAVLRHPFGGHAVRQHD
jgi:hypothetical protein